MNLLHWIGFAIFSPHVVDAINNYYIDFCCNSVRRIIMFFRRNSLPKKILFFRFKSMRCEIWKKFKSLRRSIIRWRWFNRLNKLNMRNSAFSQFNQSQSQSRWIWINAIWAHLKKRNFRIDIRDYDSLLDRNEFLKPKTIENHFERNSWGKNFNQMLKYTLDLEYSNNIDSKNNTKC